MTGDRWTCTVCSTLNEAGATTCVVCLTSPADADVPRVPTATIVRGAPAPTPSRPAPEANRIADPPPAAPIAPDAEPVAARGPSRLVLPVLAVVLLAAVVGIGIAVMAGGGGDEEETTDPGSTVTTVEPSPTTEPDVSVDPTPATAVEETTTSSTTTTLPPARGGRLFAGEAVVRDAPSLGGGEIRRISGRDGLALEVVEEATVDRPWYRVRIDGVEGYVFGAFVLPPASGLCVAVGHGTPPVYDELGAPVPDEKSGEKVLITGPAQGSSYPVVLPGGRRAFVFSHDIGAPECG